MQNIVYNRLHWLVRAKNNFELFIPVSITSKYLVLIVAVTHNIAS